MSLSKLKEVNWRLWAQRCLPYLAIFLLAYISIEFQIAHHAVLITSDRFLHYYRFYDDAMQIKTGNYSLFQMNYGFNQSGRIFNALYGPAFSYLNGLLILLCHTWFRYNILTDMIVYLVGGIGMYKLGQKAKVNNFLALLLALLYMQFGLIIGMIQANNFSGWGAALAPYAMMHAVNMMQDRERPIHWVSLALIMAILAQIHVLSTVILALTLVPFAVYGLIVTPNKKRMVLDFFKALGSCILLSANIWGGLMVVYSKNKIASPDTFQLAAYTVRMSHSVFRHGELPFMIVILLLVQLLYVCFHIKQDVANDMYTFVSLFALLVASKYFPWAHVQGRFPFVGQLLQFPFRLIVGAIPLFLVGFGVTFTKLFAKRDKLLKKWIILALVLALVQSYSDTARKVYQLTTEFLDPGKVVSIVNYYKISPEKASIRYFARHTNNGQMFNMVERAEPDYLPVKTHADNDLYSHVILDKQNEYPRKVVGDKMYIYWQSKKPSKRRLPIVMYQQSRLIVNGKDQSDAPKNSICVPKVQGKKGKNVAVLSFQIPSYFWFLLAIAGLSWLVLLIAGIRNWVRKRHEYD